MNKIFLILLCQIIIIYHIKSQTIPRNTWATGMDFSLFFTLDKEDPGGSLYLAPLVEYYPVNNAGLGLKGIIDFSKTTVSEVTTINTQKIVQPYIKWFIINRLYIIGGSQFDLDYDYQPNLHWGLGYAAFFGNRTALEPLLEFNHNFSQYAARPFRMNFGLGLHYYFKNNSDGR